jgi:hypothetical protein
LAHGHDPGRCRPPPEQRLAPVRRSE